MKKTTILAGTTAALAAGALLVPQGAANAAEKVKFGAALNPSVQPSNSLPGLGCPGMGVDPTCSFVQNEAYGRPGDGHKAPVSGTLRKVRVISGGSGSFRLQLVKARYNAGMGYWEGRSKAVGPVLHVEGQQPENWDTDTYRVEKFRVNIPIRRGWQLSMISNTTSAVRCSSGGANTLMFQSPLASGEGFRPASDYDGCWTLIEGVIRR
ncbi:MAG: hypothetical protein U0R64_04900 [Candidatus Nanopelagicales bacterium]